MSVSQFTFTPGQLEKLAALGVLIRRLERLGVQLDAVLGLVRSPRVQATRSGPPRRAHPGPKSNAPIPLVPQAHKVWAG